MTPKDRNGKPAGRLERRCHLRWVPLIQMKVNPLAQRELNQARVDRLVAAFDPEQLGAPTVSHRGGYFYLIDGQHRVAVCKKWLGTREDQALQCWCYEGLAEAEEAEVFLKLNDVLPVHANARFTVAADCPGRVRGCGPGRPGDRGAEPALPALRRPAQRTAGRWGAVQGPWRRVRAGEPGRADTPQHRLPAAAMRRRGGCRDHQPQLPRQVPVLVESAAMRQPGSEGEVWYHGRGAGQPPPAPAAGRGRSAPAPRSSLSSGGTAAGRSAGRSPHRRGHGKTRWGVALRDRRWGAACPSASAGTGQYSTTHSTRGGLRTTFLQVRPSHLAVTCGDARF
jgi:hypothetical protein